MPQLLRHRGGFSRWGHCLFQIVPRPRRGNGGKRFSSVLLSASVNEFPMNEFPMTV
jgi:hypothetical protein